MRHISLFLLLLTAVSAQAQSTRLPNRKPSGTSTPAPARTNSVAPAPATRTAARSEIRPASTRLPESRSVQAAPQATAPAPRAGSQRPARRSSGGGSRSSGGLAYHKGDNLLQIGVGLSSYYYGNPFGITFEHGVSDDVSFGAQIDYNSSNYGGYYYGYSGYYGWGYSATYYGLRASYHANRILGINSTKFDIYAGAGLGYISFKWNDDDYNYRRYVDYRSRIFLNYFIGSRYYFSPKIGAYVELGYTGLSSTRIGLTARF